MVAESPDKNQRILLEQSSTNFAVNVALLTNVGRTRLCSDSYARSSNGWSSD